MLTEKKNSLLLTGARNGIGSSAQVLPSGYRSAF
jgi:hypothetical protein